MAARVFCCTQNTQQYSPRVQPGPEPVIFSFYRWVGLRRLTAAPLGAVLPTLRENDYAIQVGLVGALSTLFKMFLELLLQIHVL